MKNNKNLWITVTLFVFLQLFVSCLFNPKDTITLKMSCFPPDSKGMGIYYLGFKGDSCIDQQYLATIESIDKPVIVDIEVKTKKDCFYIALVDSDGSSSKYSICITQESDYYDINGYWVNNYWNSEDSPLFAIHESYFQSIPFNSDLELNFTNAPFYLFTVDGYRQNNDGEYISKFEKIKINIDDMNNVAVYVTDDPEYAIKQDYSRMKHILPNDENVIMFYNYEYFKDDFIHKDNGPKQDIVYYFIIKPESYESYFGGTQTFLNCSFLLYDIQPAVGEVVKNNYAKPISHCCLGSDQNLYFSEWNSDGHCYDNVTMEYSGENKSLNRYDFQKKEMVKLLETEEPVKAVVSNESGVYCVTKNFIYKYDYQTGKTELMLTPQISLWQAIILDNKLLGIEKEQYGKSIIIDLDTLETKESGGVFYQPSSFTYIPEQNRVYYINSPQSIYYSQYDSDFNYLNYAYFYDNTIGKHYPIGNKIYRFGNESLKLLTNYGTIISIENNSNDITTKYEGTIMDAGYENSIYLFACDKDYFYPLMYRRQRNEKDLFYIEKRAFNDPLTTICKSKEFTETPLLLKAEKGKIVLISQGTLSKDEWDRNVYTMPVYYEVFDSSLNSVSKK